MSKRALVTVFALIGVAGTAFAEHAYIELPTAFVIYKNYYHEYNGEVYEVHYTQEQVDMCYQEAYDSREDLWRASNFTVLIQPTFIEIERTITTDQLQFWGNACWMAHWSCDGVNSVAKDLRDAGFLDNDLSVTVVYYAFKRSDDAEQLNGGGTYGVDTGLLATSAYCAMAVEAPDNRLDHVTTHEYLHAVDTMFIFSDISGGRDGDDLMAHADQPYNFDYPADSSGHFNHWIPLVIPYADWFEIDPVWAKVRTAPDADNDGVPDSGADLPITEQSVGSSTALVDTDGDGLSDKDELTCCYITMANPLVQDTDGDGLRDGVDPYPCFDVVTNIRPGVPVIDGYLDEGVYTAVEMGTGDTDLGGDFYMAWDDGVLYVFALVYDDRVDCGWDNSDWDDSFKLRVDAQGDGWIVQGDANYEVRVLPDGDGMGGAEKHLFNYYSDPDGAWHELDATGVVADYSKRRVPPTGYNIELAIPQSLVGPAVFAEGSTVRLGLLVNDFDVWPDWSLLCPVTESRDDYDAQRMIDFTLAPSLVAGDANCDGAINAFDIDAFVAALVDPVDYRTQYPQCDVLSADANGDGVVNAFDIDPFVALLVGGA